MDIVHSSALSPFHKFYESRLKAQLSKFLLGVISHGLYLLNQFVPALYFLVVYSLSHPLF